MDGWDVIFKVLYGSVFSSSKKSHHDKDNKNSDD